MYTATIQNNIFNKNIEGFIHCLHVEQIVRAQIQNLSQNISNISIKISMYT